MVPIEKTVEVIHACEISAGETGESIPLLTDHLILLINKLQLQWEAVFKTVR